MTARASMARADLPKLRRFADELIALDAEIFDKRIAYQEDDDLGFMIHCFVGKQREHLGSICCLVDAGQDRDAGLVLRAMIEGLAMLLWAGREPAEPATAWRDFAYVLDWRLLREQEMVGEPVDRELQARILDELAMHGSRFYTDKARKCLSQGKPLPSDPYRQEWTGVSVRSMLAEVNGLARYDKIYRKTSNWSHGNIRGIADALREKQGRVSYSQADPQMAATCLAGGFQCLIQTAQRLDRHFGLGFGDRLSQLERDHAAANGVTPFGGTSDVL